MSEEVETPQLLIRVDSAPRIGAGHIARCITFADHLSAHGFKATFVCRAHAGHMGQWVKRAGHDLVLLPLREELSKKIATDYVGWLGADPIRDAAETLAVAEEVGANLILTDHYGIDHAWHRHMRQAAAPIMHIDDLCDRSLDCDLLVDQNIGRTSGDYAALVPEQCVTLCGTQFAMLRDEFAVLRHATLRQRFEGAAVRQILIALGATDPDNVTAQVLRILDRCDLPDGISLRVVLSESAPHREEVKSICEASTLDAELLLSPPELARLMAESDLAIGAPGSATWERCALGLPSILMCLAENQKSNAIALGENGAAKVLETLTDQSLCDAIHDLLSQPDLLTEMADASARLIDGAGMSRVGEQALALFSQRVATGRALAGSRNADLNVRKAEPSDAIRIYDWRYGDDSWKLYRAAQRPDLRSHLAWFSRALENPAYQLLIAELGGRPVSHIRLDTIDQGTAVEIGICVAPGNRGLGIGKRSIAEAVKIAHGQDVRDVRAEIHRDNIASERIFRACDFGPSECDGDFVHYRHHGAGGAVN